MSSPAGGGPGPQAASLGPHVVGTRVVVRRVLPGETGPSGGPAMTDVLGTCTAWSDGMCVVQPETGEPVRIRTADIVSGKPVPPRASVRHRVSPREAHGHAFVMFPDVDRLDLGEWVLRSDPAPLGRLYKRANSCLAMGEPGLDVLEAARRVEEWYADRDRPALVQVEADGPVEQALREAGWAHLPHGEVELRLGSLAACRRARRGHGRDLGMLATAAEPVEHRALAVVPGEGEPRAEGRAALDGDWLGLHALHTHLAHRRQGLAGEVVDALLEWGAEQGASTVWLHVETDNAAARAFYDSLGLRVHHLARYLAAPGADLSVL